VIERVSDLTKNVTKYKDQQKESLQCKALTHFRSERFRINTTNLVISIVCFS
jgi:hypothetical protein